MTASEAKEQLRKLTSDEQYIFLRKSSRGPAGNKKLIEMQNQINLLMRIIGESEGPAAPQIIPQGTGKLLVVPSEPTSKPSVYTHYPKSFSQKINATEHLNNRPRGRSLLGVAQQPEVVGHKNLRDHIAQINRGEAILAAEPVLNVETGLYLSNTGQSESYMNTSGMNVAPPANIRIAVQPFVAGGKPFKAEPVGKPSARNLLRSLPMETETPTPTPKSEYTTTDSITFHEEKPEISEF